MPQLRDHDIERNRAFVMRGGANFAECGDSVAKPVQFTLRRLLGFEKSVERVAQIALPLGERARFAEFSSARKKPFHKFDKVSEDFHIRALDFIEWYDSVEQFPVLRSQRATAQRPGAPVP